MKKRNRNIPTVSTAHRDLLRGFGEVDASSLRELAATTSATRDDALRACFWRYHAGRGIPEDRGGGGDYDSLRARLACDPARKRTVVFLTYENPRGAAGGINAVASRMPSEMAAILSASRSPSFDPRVLRLSPLHTNLGTRYADDQLEPVGAPFHVPFDGQQVPVTLHSVTLDGQIWHLFRAAGFFEADGGVGATDPYTYGTETRRQRDGDDSRLLRDSLFASRAVPEILSRLGKTRDLVIHAQDWEFACSALTVKEALLAGTLESAVVVLTLHNPYDHLLSERCLRAITERAGAHHWPPIDDRARTTVLTRMLPLMDAPVSVVSHQFALDLTRHPLQRGVFTAHLHPILTAVGTIGIDNGNFIRPGGERYYSEEAVRKVRRGDPNPILQEKQARRAQMLESIERYLSSWHALDPAHPDRGRRPLFGTLHGATPTAPLSTLPPHIPVFMMCGRLDPGQKGYDLVARLIEALPAGFARFILTPMSPLAEDPDVRPFLLELQDLAETRRRGEVVVLAHRMTPDPETGRSAYADAMAGCTYGLWPSLYEPFGGANEFYAMGSPVIAFATGGLVQQVLDHGGDPDLATGLLYTETFPRGKTPEAIEEEFRVAHESSPADRVSVGVYRERLNALIVATFTATALFRDNRAAYARFLANLKDMYECLSWKKPVQDYLRWYGIAPAR